MRRRLTAAGTVLAALAGFLAAPLAGQQLVLLAATTALSVGVGAAAHARLHPRYGERPLYTAAGFAVGPAMTALAASLSAGMLEGLIAQAIPLLGALLVGVVLLAQDRELDEQSEERWTPLAYALILYLAAFVLFVTVFSGRESTILAALGTGVCATLLAAGLYRPTGTRSSRVWLYAGLTGLGVAELTLALGTWVMTGLLAGAFLLLYFYVAAGLIQALLDGSLTVRLVVEYAFVGLVGLGLILSTSPWRL